MYVASYFILNAMIWYEQRALVMSKTRNALQISEENEGCIMMHIFSLSGNTTRDYSYPSLPKHVHLSARASR